MQTTSIADLKTAKVPTELNGEIFVCRNSSDIQRWTSNTAANEFMFVNVPSILYEGYCAGAVGLKVMIGFLLVVGYINIF